MQISTTSASKNKWFLFLVMMFVLISCDTQNKGVQMDGEPVFQFAILDQGLTASAPGLGYDWQTAWPILQSAYPSQISYTITEYDIERYDWSTQVITLNARASEAVFQQFHVTIDDCSIENSDKECLLKRAFIVTYNGEPLYGGIFIPDYPMPTRYQYPIIYTSLSGKGQLNLIIRPYKSVSKRYMAEDYKLYSAEEWSLIKDKRIEDLFSQLGTLVK